MGLVVGEFGLAVAGGIVLLVKSGTKHHRPSEGAEPAGNVHRTRAGKIVETEVVKPPRRVPLPVRKANLSSAPSRR